MSEKRIFEIIKQCDSFIVSTHVNPDPDALCSELAVAEYLRSLKKKVVILNNEKVPSRFHFLPGIKSIKNYDKDKNLDFEVAIIVDCGDLDRIGQVKNVITNKSIIINIDHHITNDYFGQINHVKPKASSTAEVLFDLLKHAKYPMTQNLATYLYCGIMTDTGSFRFQNTTAYTHAIVSELMKYRISPTELYKKFYETIPLSDMQLFAKVINGFEVSFNNSVISLQLSKSVFKKFSEEFDLRDAIFKFLRSIKGVEVFVILTQAEDSKTRINLRSTGKVDVAKIAHYFKGGGHRRASGCMIEGNMKQAQEKILNAIKKVL